ncbi:unnamed protein product [Closterium sp. NIES-65]|nr:unnamed protein product [Closterium sp. NIES-65]
MCARASLSLPLRMSFPSFRECSLLPLHVGAHCSIFFLSLYTTFGGSPLQVLSPSALMLANLLTLLSQLLFVFLSGAGGCSCVHDGSEALGVFARLGRPAETVRCSRFVTLATQAVTGHGTAKRSFTVSISSCTVCPGRAELSRAGERKTCALRAPLPPLPLRGGALLSPQPAAGVIRGIISVDTSLSPALHGLSWSGLVMRPLPYMRFGFMLRHIVDESSPLHGLSLNDMLAADASFSLTISGLERTTMQPVFVVKSPLSSTVLRTVLRTAPLSAAVLCTRFLCCSLHPFPLLFSAPVSSPVLCTRFLSCSLHPFPLLFSAPVSSAVLCARFTCSSLHPFPLLFSAPSTEYYAYDGEVLWEYEFLDLLHISSDLVPTLDHSRLDAVTPVSTHS